MHHLSALVVVSLTVVSIQVHCTETPPICPECINNCPLPDCECTDSHGRLLEPPPRSTQPPPPPGCTQCVFPCPLEPDECPAPTTLCSQAQLNSFLIKCDECIPQAGCKQIGCNCKTSSGVILTPPTNPPQPPQPEGCDNCTSICDTPIPFCPLLKQCSKTQLANYVPQCPDCVPAAGCQQIGCACKDCNGLVMVPPRNPAQPPRPRGCPKCDTICEPDSVRCAAPVDCTIDQYESYVYQDSQSIEVSHEESDDVTFQCICDPLLCDCIDDNGYLHTPPPPPPRVPPECESICLPLPLCPLLTSDTCTHWQLATYLLKCPECVPQAGCQQVGCECKDSAGNVLQPPNNPAQPFRPEGCPPCSTVCLVALFVCRSPMAQCTADELQKYVRKPL